MIENVGSIEYIASINTKTLKADSARADAIAKTTGDNMGKSAEQGEKRSSRAFAALARTAKLASVAVGVGIGAAIVSNVDNAIKRVDTLNNSARTFANMGFSAKETDSAMKALDQSIRGLPTSLDSAVRGVQLLAGATNDVGQAQRIFTSLNNAIIGFGGNAEQVEGAIIQMSQAFSNGKVDAQTWNSLIQNGLGPALNAIARDMGITTGELKSGLSEGTVSVKEFQNALIEMNTKGGGGMKSFEQIAKDATSGISTGWQNMNTAITRGIASIIESIGSTNISNAISNFGSGFEGVLKWVSALIPQLVNTGKQVGEYLLPKLKTLWSSISEFLPTLSTFLNTYIKPIATALGTALVVGIGLAIDALNLLITVLQPVVSWLNKNEDIVWAVVGALAAYKLALIIGGAASAFIGSVKSMIGILNVYKTQGLASAIKQTKIFQALVALPISMPAIVVAAALASIYLVYKAVQTVRGAIDAMNNAAKSEESFQRTKNASVKSIQQSIARARARGDQAGVKRGIKSLKSVLATGSYAVGGFTGRGRGDEIAGVVHKGEYVIPKELVNQNTGLPEMGGRVENNIGRIYISSEVDGERWIQRLTKEQEIVSKGMTPGALNV